MSEKSFIEQELKDFALFSNPSLTQADADYLYIVFQKKREQEKIMVLEVLDKATNKTYKCNHLGIFIIDGLIVSNKETLNENKYIIKEVQHGLNKFYVGQAVMAGYQELRYKGVISEISMIIIPSKTRYMEYFNARVVFDEPAKFYQHDKTPVFVNHIENMIKDITPA